MKTYRWSAALLAVLLCGTDVAWLEASAQANEAAGATHMTTAQSGDAETALSQQCAPGREAGAAPGCKASRSGERFQTYPASGTMRVSKILGVGVVSMDHVRVGSVEDVLLGADGRIETVVIGVGGLLGIGGKYVAVPFDLLAWNVGDVSLTTGPTSVATPQNAATTAEAAEAGPESMPGSNTTRDVLGAVEDKHTGRVTDVTGTTEARQPTGERATVLAGTAGNTPVRAELRLTKAELAAAAAFRFDLPEGRRP